MLTTFFLCFADVPVEDWSVGDVCDWLQAQGFARYVASFARENIDGDVLLELTLEELKDELGVTSLGDRKRLFEAISSLQN